MGPRYEELRRHYIEELRRAKDDVNDWWAALVDQTLRVVGNKVAAAEALRRRWPVGPAAHPRILAVVRKYYLECDRLNNQVRREREQRAEYPTQYSVIGATRPIPQDEEDQPLSPGVVVGESLFSPDTQDLANIVGKLTYWPIGVDEQGHYV